VIHPPERSTEQSESSAISLDFPEDIWVDAVVAGYGAEVDILHGLSLKLLRGEIVCILGPNGCGKSTLLKTIAGYLMPRKGRIWIAGKDVSRIPVHHKIRYSGVGFVPQTDNVFGSLSAWENLAVGGQFLSKIQAAQRIEQLCEIYPVLKKKINSPASSLSGGERQVLSLARALMPSPRVLLLDEPSAGLSPKTLFEVFEVISLIRRVEGVSVLMVEQNAMEALRISDRAYVLSLGQVALEDRAERLVQSDEMRELYLGGRPR